MSSNLTGPVLFRAIEKYHPALLIDEADSFVTKNEELRGILNSGHRKQGATSLRLVGEGHELRAFSTWGPKAIASIGSLAATLEDRAVTIPMRRRAKGEQVEKLRLDRLHELEPIRQRIARWVADNAQALRDADPEVPESLDDRAADNWRPLLAIADLAGGASAGTRSKGRAHLSEGRADEVGTKEQLIADIYLVRMAKAGTDRIASAELVSALVELEGRPWSEWNRGRPITPTGLSRQLKGFGIRSKDIRTPEGTLKGYEWAAFEDTFARYVADGNAPVAGDVAAQNSQVRRFSPRQDWNVALSRMKQGVTSERPSRRRPPAPHRGRGNRAIPGRPALDLLRGQSRRAPGRGRPGRQEAPL